MIMKICLFTLFAFCLYIPSKGQEQAIDSTVLKSTAQEYLTGNKNREWVFQPYDIDMSLANKCYSGGSFIFQKDSSFTLRNCVDNKLKDDKNNWTLRFKAPHHVILNLADEEEYFLNIYADSANNEVLWMELTRISEDTKRFSKFYKAVYAP